MIPSPPPLPEVRIPSGLFRELVGVDGPAIPLDLRTVPLTPSGPAARLEAAAREAWPTACALRAESLDQRGVDPVLVICAVDSRIGRQLVERNLGANVPNAVCGPVVFAAEWPELANALGAQAVKALEQQLETMKATAGEMVMLFAVNGRGVDLRVVRAPAPPPGPRTEPADGAPPPVPPEASTPPSPPGGAEKGFVVGDVLGAAPAGTPGAPSLVAKLPSEMTPEELAAARKALDPEIQELLARDGTAKVA